MPAPDIDYTRNLKTFTKLVARNKWQNKCLPAWWPGVKKKPIFLSEGDSWFDFPLKSLTDVLGVLLKYTIGLQNFGMDSKTNVIDYVSRDKKLDAIFLRLERSGDTAPELSAKVPNKKGGVWEDKFPSNTLYSALQNKTVQKHLDGILLSAGGNDLVSAARHGVIKKYNSTWENSYDGAKLQEAAAEIADHFLTAILYRDEFAPQATIICHSYAYPVMLSRGTTTEFDFSDVSELISLLLKFLKLEWIKKPLKAVGINLDKLGGHTLISKARLHEALDANDWPLNKEGPDIEGTSVHPDRAEFIKVMIDSLNKEVLALSQKYQAKTGRPLEKFEYLDIREMCQDEKYWSDFIHLNSKGYKKVSKVFSEALSKI